MHPKARVLHIGFWSVLLGLALGSTATAQPAPQPPKAPEPIAVPRGNALIVPTNGTQRLQMSTKKRIASVVNQKEAIARVQPLATDPTTVLITGLEPGITRITLTDVDGAVESLDVVVQFDVEYLRTLLQRAVPTANIQPIPAANNTVILTGNVASAEDVNVILQTAQSVVQGPGIINAMRV